MVISRCACQFARSDSDVALVRRVHVELHRKTLGDEVLLGEGPRQLDAVLVGELGIGRQRQHDLAGDLRVLAPLGRLRRVPQHRTVGEPSRRRPRATAPRGAPARRGA